MLFWEWFDNFSKSQQPAEAYRGRLNFELYIFTWYANTVKFLLNRLTVSNISAAFYTTIKLRMHNVLSLYLENVTWEIQEKNAYLKCVYE